MIKLTIGSSTAKLLAVSMRFSYHLAWTDSMIRDKALWHDYLIDIRSIGSKLWFCHCVSNSSEHRHKANPGKK